MSLIEEIMADMRKKTVRNVNKTITGCACSGMPPEMMEQEQGSMKVSTKRVNATEGSSSKAGRSNLMKEIMESQRGSNR